MAFQQTDAEELVSELRTSRARVQRLSSQIEAEEGNLVRSTLAEAEITATARRRLPTTAVEEQLMNRVTQAEHLLKAEQEKLRSALEDPNVKLALAVEQGVDEYYSDVHTLRKRNNIAHGLNPASSSAGANLRKLAKERDRLSDAVRSLAAETEMLSAEARIIVDSKRELAEALKRRDGMRARQGLVAPGPVPYP